MGQHIIGFFVLCLLLWAKAEDNRKRNIKGQQHVQQTAVARLVGGPVPPELMKILQSNMSIPANTFLSDPPTDPKRVPFLITDEVKTTVTRMVIPLVTNYSDSERYLTMLRRFLNRNHVNLSIADKLESSGDAAPSTAAIALKLQAAANLKANMLAILGAILAQPEGILPLQTHAPLAFIYRMLQLRRIPVVDVLEQYVKLSKPSHQEQWITVFSELEKHIPPYLKSCATFLLETMQEGVLNFDEILSNIKDDSFPKLLRGTLHQGGSNNPANKPLLFPKRILSKIRKPHEEALGRTLAAMLTTASEARRNFSPRLLALFLLQLPRNTPNPEQDEREFAMAYSQGAMPPIELAIVGDAFERAFYESAQTPSEIFRDILRMIVSRQLEGYKNYAEILADFQLPSEMYVF